MHEARLLLELTRGQADEIKIVQTGGQLFGDVRVRCDKIRAVQRLAGLHHRMKFFQGRDQLGFAIHSASANASDCSFRDANFRAVAII